jgi:hypothetical protein
MDIEEAKGLLNTELQKLLYEVLDPNVVRMVIKQKAAALGLDVSISIEGTTINVDVIENVPSMLIKVPAPAQKPSARYDSALAGLKEEYGPVLGTFLCNRFAGMIKKRKASCITDFRVCLVGDKMQEKLYHQIKSTGCCGSVDQTFTFTRKVLGIPLRKQEYRIGFNYGH